MMLVDTSVWIEFMRRRRPLDLEAIVPIEEAVTCLPVIHEVLQGIDDESQLRVTREAMLSLERVEDPIGAPLVEEAVALYRAARRRGLTVRSSVDCLIAACALRHGLTVLHRDRGFTALARVSGLLVREA